MSAKQTPHICRPDRKTHQGQEYRLEQFFLYNQVIYRIKYISKFDKQRLVMYYYAEMDYIRKPSVRVYSIVLSTLRRYIYAINHAFSSVFKRYLHNGHLTQCCNKTPFRVPCCNQHIAIQHPNYQNINEDAYKFKVIFR